jgi:hypothetical protein
LISFDHSEIVYEIFNSPVRSFLLLVSWTQLSVVHLVVVIHFFLFLLIFSLHLLVLKPLLTSLHRLTSSFEDCADEVGRLGCHAFLAESIVIICTFETLISQYTTAAITKIQPFGICKLKNQFMSIGASLHNVIVT